MKLNHFLIFFLGTLSPATNTPIPTVTDNAFAQGLITADEIGISFEPTTVPEIVNGELTWGTYAINCIIRIIVLTDVMQVEPTAASLLAQLRSCMYSA